MHRQKLLAGALVAASHLCAAVSLDLENAFLRRTDDLVDTMRRDAYDALDKLERREFTRTQPFPNGPPPTNVPEPNLSAIVSSMTATGAAEVPGPTVTPASGNASTFNPTDWNSVTEMACESAMMKLNGQASNPSGIDVCYNLPFLDNRTGVFEAELRMYNISKPIDPWVGIATADMQVSLSYLGAMVQSANTTVFKRDEEIDGVLMDFAERDLEERQQPAMQPVVIKRYVGKINSNLMGSASSDADLKQFLIPTIDLSAQRPGSQDTVSATLSSTEASFVSGIFAQAVTTTTNPAAAQASASAFAATATIFQVPGVDLGIFPIGLIVTLIWTVGFFVAVGLGTLGRVQFRDQYRRNIKRQQAAGFRTI